MHGEAYVDDDAAGAAAQDRNPACTSWSVNDTYVPSGPYTVLPGPVIVIVVAVTMAT
jgi:hypothetical protein